MIWGISGLRALVTVVMTAVLAAVLALAAVPAHAAAPANDDFADAEQLVGLPVSVTGTNVDATIESGEPEHAGVYGEASVWYRWTAPVSSHVKVDATGSDFNAVVAVYTGSDVADLTDVSIREDGVWSERRASFNAEAGSVYYVAVVGGYTGQGNIQLEIAAASQITGTVTGADGAPLEGVRVTVCRVNGLCEDDRYTRTGGAGAWAVGGLDVGEYRVRFQTDGVHHGEWYDDQRREVYATSVFTTEGGTVSGVDAELALLASISGIVTDSAGAGLEGVTVSAKKCGSVGDGPKTCNYPTYAVTDSSGVYRIPGLGTGDYKVYFSSDGVRLGEWYDDQRNEDSATWVEVGYSEAVTGVDAELLTEAEWEAANAPECAGQAATIVGTSGDDVLVGTAGPDVIHGLAGDDTIRGLGGDDVICGGGGADELRGGSGHDLLIGGSGSDHLYGGGAGDTLRGGPGNDLLKGNAGWDTLIGGRGGDEMRGGRGNDLLRGNGGWDTLIGGPGGDTLRGGWGKDLLKGNGGWDTLIGGPRGDTLKGGRGNDLIKGNGGWDTLVGGPGHDRLKGGRGKDLLKGNAGRDTLYGGPARDKCNGGRGTDTATACEVLRRIP